jgi:hypothetical protein
MKVLLPFLLLLFNCFYSLGQNQLLRSYTQEELDFLKKNKVSDYEILAYAVDNGLEFGEYNEVKHSNLNHVSNEVSIKEASFLDFNFKIENQNQYYYWKEQDKIIMVKSYWVLNHERNRKL